MFKFESMPASYEFKSFLPKVSTSAPYLSLNPLSAAASVVVILLLFWML